MNNRLFNSEASSNFFRRKIGAMQAEALSLDDSVFESNTIEEIKRNFLDRYMIDPIELLEKQKDTDIEEISIYHDATRDPIYIQGYDDDTYMTHGYKVIITIPFNGCPELFRLQPSQSLLKNFEAEIVTNYPNQKIKLKFEFEEGEVDEEANVIKSRIDKELEDYKSNISYINSDTNDYNQRLKSEISNSIESRLSELRKLKEIKTALKIPLKKSSSPNSLNKVEIKPNKISPLGTKSGDTAVYISEKDYNTILSSIRNMGSSMESNRAAENQDEEGLRDILLVGLSASIEVGNAVGEAFRKKGKTDISIVFENKAAFIAECKIWKGKKYINSGIDQLLRYTTWRDAKLAYIIFNKDRQNFSEIQEQIPKIISERKDYVKDEGKQKDGEWRFTLLKPDDENRHITVHIFAFDVSK